MPYSHKDLAKDAAPHFRKAKKYYDTLASEMVSHGHICDIFSCALDNVRAGMVVADEWGRGNLDRAHGTRQHGSS